MSTYSAIVDNGLTSAEGFNKVMSQLLVSGIPTITNPTSLQAVQRGAGANMSVDVSIGSALVPNSIGTFGYAAWQDAVSNVGITASNPSNSRIDAVVAYINLAAVSTTQNNNPASFVFTAIAGTPGGSPSAPTNSTIQAALGATVPWVRLANVTVPANATQIVSANIVDARSPFAVRSNLWGGTNNTYGHAIPNVTDDTIALLLATQSFTHKTITDSTNVVSSATLSNPYKFLVYRNAVLSTSGNASLKVAFDTKVFDTGSNVDIVTNVGRFTAPVAGFYRFSGFVSGTAFSSDSILVDLYKNASLYLRGNQVYASASVAISVAIPNVPIQLAANDYIEVYFTHSVAGNLGLSVGLPMQTYFGGELVSTS